MLQQARCCQHGRWWTKAPSCKLWHLYRWSYTTDHQAPRAITSHSRRGSTARDRPSALSHLTARLDVTPKTTEQNRIVRTGKSEAEVTNNKKMCSRYCTIEANCWQTRSIVRPLCDSRTTRFVMSDVGLSSCVLIYCQIFYLNFLRSAPLLSHELLFLFIRQR